MSARFSGQLAQDLVATRRPLLGFLGHLNIESAGVRSQSLALLSVSWHAEWHWCKYSHDPGKTHWPLFQDMQILSLDVWRRKICLKQAVVKVVWQASPFHGRKTEMVWPVHSHHFCGLARCNGNIPLGVARCQYRRRNEGMDRGYPSKGKGWQPHSV